MPPLKGLGQEEIFWK